MPTGRVGRHARGASSRCVDRRHSRHARRVGARRRDGPGICARASLTPRYFYESFAGADALVEATYDLIIGEIAERALAGFDAGSSPRGKVVGAVEAIVDVIESDPRKGRVMFSDTLRSPVIAAKRAEMITLFTNLTFQSAPAVAKVSGGQETLAAAHFQVGGLGRVLASWTEGSSIWTVRRWSRFVSRCCFRESRRRFRRGKAKLTV